MKMNNIIDWNPGMLIKFRHGGKNGKEPWRTGLIIETNTAVEMATIFHDNDIRFVHDSFIEHYNFPCTIIE